MKRLKNLLFFILLLIQAFTSVNGQVNKPIKVACIGDSITEGFGLTKEESYPEKLKALLGTEYQVMNYGVSGTTMLKDPNDGGTLDEKHWSYWESEVGPGDGGKEQYDLALASIPDIIIIKFGTNDAREEVWRSGEGYGKKNFYNNYVEFINSFRAVNPNVIVYICYSLPSLKDQTTDQRSRIREEVIPVIKQVARKNQAHLIDLHSVFRGKTGLLQADDVHPNAAGAELIANEVFKMIKMTYKP